MLVFGIMLFIFGGVGLLLSKGSEPVIIEGDTEEEISKKEKAFNFWLKRHEIVSGIFITGIIIILVSILLLFL